MPGQSRYNGAMKRFPTLAIFALAACVASAQYHGSKEVPKEFAAGFKAITIEDAKAWLGYLAGPECEGRGSGQDGFLKAADFMAAKFKEFGLKPMGDKDSYFQYVPYGRGTVKSGSIKLGEKEFALDEALSLNGFLESKTMTRKTIVFLAAKGEAATLDTYNLKDQVVVANLEGVSREFRRALNASGAAMIILVTDTISSNHSTQVFGALPTPSGRITADLAKTMATAAGVAMPVLEDGKVNALIGLENATITVDVETERKDMPNVVGLLEGSDKTLKAEYIGIGAHLDHLGKRGDHATLRSCLRPYLTRSIYAFSNLSRAIAYRTFSSSNFTSEMLCHQLSFLLTLPSFSTSVSPTTPDALPQSPDQ